MTRGKHTTMYGVADRVLKRIEASPLVTRVILGKSVGKSHYQQDGKVLVKGEVLAGLKILIYGSKGVTEGYVYCTDKAAVRELIEAL